jgi:purine nucleoside permease
MASSITALANDDRFDLSHAYWILAGTAGIDPNVGSLGSAAWARYVVDGDLSYEIDPRKIPHGWDTGYVPYGRTVPFQLPRPPASSSVELTNLSSTPDWWIGHIVCHQAAFIWQMTIPSKR